MKHKPDIYCAVLERNCTPHYYKNFYTALNYLLSEAPDKFTLELEDGNNWVINKVGWIQECYFED